MFTTQHRTPSGAASQAALLPFFSPKSNTSGATVQRSGEEGTTKDSNPLGDLIAKQLSDKEFKKHIVSLGEVLQSLAIEATDPTKKPGAGATQSGDTQARFTALHIKFLFETQADKILKDPALKAFRDQVSGIVKGSPATALALALTGVMVAYLADVGLKIPAIDEKIGAGFSAGGSADAGKAQSPELKHADAFVKFAKGLFSVKVQGAVDKDKEGKLVGSGKGEVKVGNADTSAMAALQVDTNNKWVLSGRLSTDLLAGKSRDFTLFTGVKWPLGSKDALLTPGFSGKWKFAADHSLVFGTNVQVSTLTGLKGVDGYLEYQHGLMRIRLDGNLSGIAKDKSLDPTRDMRIQATIIVPLSFLER